KPERADAVAVVAPGIIEHVGRRSTRSEFSAKPLAESEPFEIEADIDREPLAMRPVIAAALDDRRIGIAAMTGSGHGSIVAAGVRNVATAGAFPIFLDF